NPVRHPVKMSDFQEKPKFYLAEQRNLGQHSTQCLDSDQTVLCHGVLKSLVLKEMIRLAKTQFDDGTSVRNKRYKLKSQKSKARRKL
ncbi:MAG: hypothetical protein JW870_07085, partial [Candidatus Delongbacteria bacterium]|nr:hypothetical protein [Candidatus Delongbacteria bacterium]